MPICGLQRVVAWFLVGGIPKFLLPNLESVLNPSYRIRVCREMKSTCSTLATLAQNSGDVSFPSQQPNTPHYHWKTGFRNDQFRHLLDFRLPELL